MKRRLELAVVAAVALLDQATKLLVVMELGLHETIEVVPGLLNLTHVRNSGVAFGFLNAAELRVQAGVDGGAGVRRADRRGAVCDAALAAPAVGRARHWR